MQSWITDLRYAVRRLAKSPGLGIALSDTMDSVVRNVLVAGLPFLQRENVAAWMRSCCFGTRWVPP